MAPEGVKPRISEFFPELLRSWREVTRKYPNSRHDWTAALSFIFPFGRSIKKLSIRIPFASDSSWWPATARQLTQSLESSSLVASISDFLCRSSPRSSGRHAYLHCTYFLNVENVAGVVGKANNRVTVTTCLLTRDKWQKQEKKKKKEKREKRKKKKREREKVQEDAQEASKGGWGIVRREKNERGRREHGRGIMVVERKRKNAWEKQRFKAQHGLSGRTILIGADVN